MVRTDPRRAGAVRRYHTWPTIQTQTVAEASWNVVRILVTIWPDAPAEAITHALLNDCGEIVTGDLPFPVKRDNRVLKDEIVRLEETAIIDMGLAPQESCRDQVWRDRVKICDMLEMWEFGLDETAMGNRYAQPIVEGTLNDVARLIQVFRLSNDDFNRIKGYTEWRKTRTPA